MKFISLDEVLAIYDEMLKLYGGKAGIHDFTLLHSAIERPNAQFRGKFLYQSVWQMAAAMLQSLVKNHPFEDGNKRTALVSTARFLYKNGHDLFFDQDELIEFMVGVDTKNRSLEEITVWLRNHSR